MKVPSLLRQSNFRSAQIAQLVEIGTFRNFGGRVVWSKLNEEPTSVGISSYREIFAGRYSRRDRVQNRHDGTRQILRS
jgi:hypothetical protein